MAEIETAFAVNPFGPAGPLGSLGHGADASRGLTRRRLLRVGAAASAAWLGACSTPLPLVAPPAAGADGAGRLLGDSAQAHGLAAYRRLADINLAYDGEWKPGIDRIQPVVVDKPFRGRSEERLMPHEGLVAQAYTGVAGVKQVAWRRGSGASGDTGDVAVWVNGRRNPDPAVLAASALVAEAYGLFLLGPLWLVDRDLALQRDGEQRIDGRRCHALQVWLRPGLGRAPLDRATLFLDAESGLMRRVRFTLEGTATTRGAVAEVDTFEHRELHGIRWPMRSYERVVHPLRLPAHEWRITGLDVDRGYAASALLGPTFGAAAAAPAAPLAIAARPAGAGAAVGRPDDSRR